MNVYNLLYLLRFIQSNYGFCGVLEIIGNKLVLIDRQGLRATWKVITIEMDNMGMIISTTKKPWEECNGAYQDPEGDRIEQERASEERGLIFPDGQLQPIRDEIAALDLHEQRMLDEEHDIIMEHGELP